MKKLQQNSRPRGSETMNARPWVVGVLVCVFTLLGGCSYLGALSPAEAGGSACGPGDENDEFLFATDLVINNSPAYVEVIDVTPNDGDNLMVRDFAIGYQHRGDVGGLVYPKDYDIADNKQIEPGERGTLQLILKLLDPSREGNASSVKVTYVAGASNMKMTIDTKFSLRLVPHGSFACIDKEDEDGETV